jgi:hypothetical protein
MLAVQLAVPLNVLESFCIKLADNDKYKLVRQFEKQCGKKLRTLCDLQSALKVLNKKINLLLQKIELPSELYGGVPGKSAKDNAMVHVGNRHLISLDVKEFFPSLHSHKIKELFMRVGCSAKVAKMLTDLTTFGGAVPQGFPTSTAVANLYVAVFCLDKIKAVVPNVAISFWVDDINVSSKAPIPGKDINAIKAVLSLNLLAINSKKTKKRGPHQSKDVTGIGINNGRLDITKDYLKKTERDLFLLRKYGAAWVVENKYHEKYQELKKGNKNIPDWFMNHMKGVLRHIGDLNQLKYKKLLSKYRDVVEGSGII